MSGKDLFGNPVVDPAMVSSAIYIDCWTDEVCPASLEDWAQYLAGCGTYSPEDGQPLVTDGEVMDATVQDYLYVPVKYEAGSWHIPFPPEGWMFHAIAHGPHGGWSAEDMAYDEAGIHDLLAEVPESTAVLVLARMENRTVKVRWLSKGPTCEIVAEDA